ncbi:MAG: carboxypeptidase regulatory-like domain-containing protein [Deltaproteobacteria bacterium]|nr:carboxypeptidase regulatory-like domain-containing protein [Deltaproteobacteria bacterium]
MMKTASRYGLLMLLAMVTCVILISTGQEVHASDLTRGELNYSVRPMVPVSDHRVVLTFPSPSNTAGCTFTVMVSQNYFPASGGSGQISMTVVSTGGAICTWSASSSDNWISVSGGGSSSGTVPFYVYPNTSSNFPRTGTLIFSTSAGTYGVDITQDASTPTTTTTTLGGCSYQGTVSSSNFPYTGGQGQVNMIVMQSGGGGCFWSISSDVDWISALGGGSSSGSAGFTVGPNTSSSPRTGTIIAATTAGYLYASITQDGAPTTTTGTTTTTTKTTITTTTVTTTTTTTSTTTSATTSTTIPASYGELLGEVRDEATGLPVMGANVSTDVGNFLQITNTAGSFYFRLSPRIYLVTFKAPGYISRSANAAVSAGQVIQLTIVLTPNKPSITSATASPGGILDDEVTTSHLMAVVSHPNGLGDIAQVTADLSPIGGNPYQPLVAAGADPDDRTAGGTYGADITAKMGTSVGSKNIVITAVDKMGFTDRAPVTLSVGHQATDTVTSASPVGGDFSNQITGQTLTVHISLHPPVTISASASAARRAACKTLATIYKPDGSLYQTVDVSSGDAEVNVPQAAAGKYTFSVKTDCSDAVKFWTVAKGSGTGVLGGLVTDAFTNQRLTGVSVDTTIGVHGFTSDGLYFITAPAGKADVTYSLTNYQDTTQTGVVIDTGAVQEIDMVLNPTVPQYSLGLNGTTFSAGTPMTLSANVSNQSPDIKADVYISITLPTGTTLYYPDFSPTAKPVVSNLLFPKGLNIVNFILPPFENLILPALPAGDYAWQMQLTLPGKSQLIGNASKVSFSFKKP